MARQNHSTNPALKNDATGWSDGSRVTGLTGFERTTGYQGAGVTFTHAPDPAQFAYVPGTDYTFSFSYEMPSGASPAITVAWYDSGGAFISAPTQNPTGTDGGVVYRASLVFNCPAEGAQVDVQFKDFPSGTNVTAMLIETGDTGPLEYFDGDSTNATWDGADGNSTSTLTEALPSYIRGVSTAESGGASSVTAPLPAGTVDGDPMVAYIVNDFIAASPVGSTWETELQLGSSAADTAANLFSRTAGASEPVDFTFDVGASTSATLVIVAFNGAEVGTTWDVDPGATDGSGNSTTTLVASNTTAPNTRDITTTRDNALFVGFFGTAQDTTGFAGHTPPTGTDEIADVIPVSANKRALLLVAEPRPTAGAVGTRTATNLGDAITYVTVAMALSPPGDTLAAIGDSGLTAAASGTATKTAATAGDEQLTVAAAGTATKTATDTGDTGFTATAAGTGLKVAFATGTAGLSLGNAGATDGRTADGVSGDASLTVAASGATFGRTADGVSGDSTVDLAASGTLGPRIVDDVTGTATVDLAAAGSGTKTATTAGDSALTIDEAGTATKTATTAGDSALVARAAGTAEKTATATGDATLTVDNGGQAEKAATVTGDAALTVAAESGPTDATRTVNGSAALTAAAAGHGEKAAVAEGYATLDAAAAGTVGPATRGPVTGTATVGLAAAGTATGERTRAGTATLAAAATGTATADRPATGTAAMALAAEPHRVDPGGLAGLDATATHPDLEATDE